MVSIRLKQLLRTDLTFVTSQANGQIFNLISNDVSRIEDSVLFFGYLYISPIILIVAIAYLANMNDPTFLTGFSLMVFIIFAQIVLAKFSERFQ